MTNFTSEDLVTSLGALCMFALLVVPPAWLLCELADPFSFRRLNALRKAQLIMVVSVSALPSLDFIIGRFFGFQSAAYFNVLSIVFLIAAIIFKRSRAKAAPPTQSTGVLIQKSDARTVFIALAFALTWIVIAILSLVDWQTTAGSIFPSITVQDYVKNNAITDAVRRTGVPPVTPMFLSENKDKLFYYYFWFMQCGLGPTLTQGAITARAAVIAGTAWVGIAVLSLAAFFSTQLSQARSNRSLIAIIACVLIFVTGLDLIPVSLGDFIALSHNQLPIFASVDWWNVFLNNFSSSSIGIPQHVAGLIVGFFATLLLRQIQKYPRQAAKSIPLAALCIASAPGVSIYVTLVFVIVWAVWFLLSFKTTGRLALGRLAFTALLAACLAAPYVLEMVKANHSHGQQLAFYVRPMTFVSVIIHPLLANSQFGNVIESLVNLFVLPFNYFMELGFFFIASLLYWRGRKPISGDERLLLLIFWVSLLAGSFIRSTVFNNDFGWRSTLPAQFALLLWSAFYTGQIISRRQKGEKPLTPILALFLAASFSIGLGGSIYDLVMLRIAHSIGMRDYVGVNDGERNYDLRQLYEKISTSLPESIVMQHNPEVLIDTYAGNYGNRQVVFSDRTYGTLMGTDPTAYTTGSLAVEKIFKDASVEEMESIRHKYGINVLVVKSSDPIWHSANGWTKAVKPYFENAGGAIYRFDL